ncbi:MAG: alpha/beta hydrolase [Treponema sp.]|nr:alpha/beta hydrolase [Treponema sp.]
MKGEKFSCKRDNLTIRGLLYRPEAKKEKYPLAILSHGFMANYKSTKKYAERFAEMGFLSICYDFNGGSIISKSDGKSTKMSVLTEKEDLKAVIKAAIELPFVDADDISLVGFSQGGFVSAMVANDLQEKIKRIILFYPALCIPDDARKGQMIWAKFDPQNLPEKLRCGPMKLGKCFVQDVIGMNAFDQIKGYRGPVMLIHGTKDSIVSADYSKQAYKAYFTERGEKPSKDLQLVLIDQANHGFIGKEGNLWNKYAFFAIEKFLEKKEILFNVDVILTSCEDKMEGQKKHSKLFFKGHAQSPYFTGDVIEPAYDYQVHIGDITESCCADYKVEGKDFEGNDCIVNIKNELYPKTKDFDINTEWKPSVSTNSQALSRINNLNCETYAEMRPQGPMIHIWG